MIRRGQVWIADFGKPQGHEQAEVRPAAVLQVNELNHLTTAVVIPFTTNLKRSNTAATVLVEQGEGGLTSPSVALCHQIRALDVRKLRRLIGDLPPVTLYEIEAAVAFVLGLPS